jgi:hypothetical protein
VEGGIEGKSEYGGHIMCNSGEMRPVETIQRTGGGRIKENDGGMNLTKIYCKHFCKCCHVPPVQ